MLIFNDTIIIISSGITSTAHITDVAPTILGTAATLEIAIVMTGVSAFIVGVLAGALLYHCIRKHRSHLKPESSSHQQQQTDPEYEEVPVTSGNKKFELRANMAYEPVQH